jgi:hypothetical protein
VGAIGVDELSRAFEVATLKVENCQPADYPLLEVHTEGTRTIVVPRATANKRTSGRDPATEVPSFQQLDLRLPGA